MAAVLSGFLSQVLPSPRDSDSLQSFLQKLAEKNQSVVNQEQAAQSVKLYYETLKNWPNDSAVAMPSDAWAPVFKHWIGSGRAFPWSGYGSGFFLPQR